jgi:TonB family protein
MASFSIVPPPPTVVAGSVSATPVESADRREYQEAALAMKPVLPVYPPRALAGRAGAAHVGVRLTIDEKGRVTDVSPSLLAVTIAPPQYTEDFRQAVETAVRQWKFQPARIEYVETVSEHGITYERLKRVEKLETTLDLAFDFTTNGGVQAAK